jgi:hypothetical protein
MGKIYQPEVAAKAIYYAAHHHRRTIYVGSATAQTIIGNMLFPGLLDNVLAKNGYQGQQTAEDELAGRPDNLWEPVAEDRGSHGSFDHIAKDSSMELEATTNRGATAAVALAAGLLTAGLMYWMKNGED